MRINQYNEERYTKKVLIFLIKKLILNWLGEYPNYFQIDLSDLAKNCGRYKMELIKKHIIYLMKEKENLWYVYDTIKDFYEFEELLNFLAPTSYYSPEGTLLYYLRRHKKINVKFDESRSHYSFSIVDDKKIPCTTKEQKSNISVFFRSYTEILLDIKKSAYHFDTLLNWVVNEEIDYSLAKNNEIFFLFYKKQGYDVVEVLKLLDSDGLKTPKEIYIEQIKRDHHRFYKIIDNYYGLKSWSRESNFKVHIELFDRIYQDQDEEYIDLLGYKVLELLPDSSLSDREKKQIKNLITRIIEGG